MRVLAMRFHFLTSIYLLLSLWILVPVEARLSKDENKPSTTQKTKLSTKTKLKSSSKTPVKASAKAPSLKRVPNVSPELVKDSVFKEWTLQLKKIQTNLNEDNFSKAEYETICPTLEKLKTQGFKNTKHSEEYFTQVIKFFGAITEYSLNFTYYYCLASFTNDPEHRFLELFSKELSQQQKNKLKDMLDVSYSVDSESNGNVIPHSMPLTSEKEFSQMNKKEKQAHSKQLRDFYLDMEETQTN